MAGNQKGTQTVAIDICVLASGSSGNCTLVASNGINLLVDAGISARETEARLAGAGASIGGIEAILVSHEHSDHRGALRALQRKTAAALYANAATIEALEQDTRLRDLEWNVFTTGQPFEIGDIRVEPFSVPHDSYDPVGFVLNAGNARAGIVTDMGVATGLIRERLKSCSVLVLEANHDEELLRESERPWSLKQRIMGRQGHFSNRQAAELLREIAGPHLRTVLLAHLSADCNRPDLAAKTVRDALAECGQGHVEVKLTYPDRASDTVSAIPPG